MKIFVISYVFIINIRSYECPVASTKCSEYAKAVYTKVESPVLTRKRKEHVQAECGIVSVPLIVGGTSTSEMEFPHMAVIGFASTPQEEVSWQCGGSLISEVFVLTAAHCLENPEIGPAQKVLLGSRKTDIIDPESQEKSVIERIPHPDYKSTSKDNDIALIKMDSPVTFTPYVRPACLDTEDVTPGTEGIATGFGKQTYNAKNGSSMLLKVTIEVYENDMCKKIKKASSKDDITICAGHLPGGKDTCQGDSGGPLQLVMENPFCMYKIIGVTSYGKFCGFPESPAIYSKVFGYIPWIESIVWK